ncbi:MAG TPA: CoA-binding protein [Mariprofundaceae bacterium]|nr:CoA-binding protein [Mariprofundaceae bacterium]
MKDSDSWQNPSDAEIGALLKTSKTIAVVGCSPKPDRASHQIASFLLDHGYHVIPVHPQAKEILGQQVYPNLESIPEPVDIVDVFRRAEFIGPVADSAIAIRAKALWLQQGIIDPPSWQTCTDEGLICVMDRCIAVMHRLLIR